MSATARTILGPEEGELVHLFDLGVRFMIDGETSAGAFSLVEYQLPPHTLGAPLHTHHREEEYSFVVTGRLGLQLGDDVLEAKYYPEDGDFLLEFEPQVQHFEVVAERPIRE